MDKVKLLSIALLVSLVLNGMYFLENTKGISSEKESISLETPGIKNLSFKKDILEVSFLTDMNPKAAHFEVIPPVKFESVWEGSRKMKLTFKEKLIPGKKYFLRNKGKITDFIGRNIGDEMHKFFSQNLKVKMLQIHNYNGDAAEVCIEFNGKISIDQLRQHLKVFGKGESEKKYKIIDAERNAYIISVDAAKEQQLQFIIDADITAKKAEKPLGEDFKSTLTLNKDLKITYLKAENYRDGFRLKLNLNRNVDADKLLKFLEIQPPISFSLNRNYYPNSYWLKGDFKAASTYKLTLKKGMTSVDLSEVNKDIVRSVSTGDLNKRFYFLSKGPFFPAGRQFRVPIKVVGHSELKLMLTEVFPNNITQFMQSGRYALSRVGKTIYEKKFQTGVTQNEVKKVYLNLDEALQGKTGIFVLKVNSINQWGSESCTLIKSNLGMSLAQTKRDLQVWAFDLNTGAPTSDTEVELLSYANQSLGRKKVDSVGLVNFDLESLSDKPYLVKLSDGKDVSYRNLDGPINLSAFRMAGKVFNQSEYEAYVFAERDACRPGESMDFSIILRDRAKKAVGGFPVEMIVRNPEKKIILKQVFDLPKSGFVSKKVKLNKSSRTGYHTFEIRLPGDEKNIIGKKVFLVNTYTPDTFKVSISSELGLQSGTEIPVDVKAVYNFGGALSKAKLQVKYGYESRSFSSEKYKSYSFGDPERKIYSLDTESLSLDENGLATCALKVKKDLRPAAIGNIRVKATVTDSTGRSATQNKVIQHMPYPYLLGVSKEMNSGEMLNFNWVRINQKEEEVDSVDEMSWELVHKNWHYAYRENNEGRYIWDWSCERKKIKAGRISESGTSGVVLLPSPEKGQYEFVLTARDGQVRTVLDFNVGTNSDKVRLGNSEFVKLYSDKRLYLPGEVARLRFESPADGYALLRLSDSDLYEQQFKKVHRGWNVINVKVPNTKEGSVYAALTLVRKLNEDLPLPARFFGLLKLGLDKSSKDILIDLQAPEKVEPGSEVKVSLTAAEKKRIQVKLMAVDSGVLSLTNFKTPNPYDYFFKNRSLSTKFFDIFEKMFPELNEKFGVVSLTGGGKEYSAMRGASADLNLVESHVVTLGIVETDKFGKAKMSFKAPKFNGSMRLMAIAVSDDSFGSVEQKLIVKDKVTLLSGSVKALTPGDELILPLKIINNQKVDLKGSIEISAKGPVKIGSYNRDVTLSANAQVSLPLKISALKKPGMVTLNVSFSALGISSKKEVTFLIRPGNARESRGEFGRISAGEKLSLDVGAGWLAGTQKTSLIISTSSASEMYTYFKQLQSYPYGCLEQTTSKAFVNLFASQLAPLEDQQNSLDIVQAALDRIGSMQRYNGGFSMWTGGQKIWPSASIYAAHFMGECKTRGLSVNPYKFQSTIRFLKNFVSRQYDSSPEDRAYAMYVLALNGQLKAQAPLSMLESTHSVLAKVLACGALALTGKNAKAVEAFGKLDLAKLTSQEINWDMDTPLRRNALVSMVAQEMFGANGISTKLHKILLQSLREQQWLSTQDKALICLGVGKRALLLNESSEGEAIVKFNDKEHIVSQGSPFAVNTLELKSIPEILNSEKGPVFYSYVNSGVPLNSGASVANGLHVSREYLDGYGNRKDTFIIGDLVKVQINVKAEQVLKDTVILDLLPGCFEVESAYLKSRDGGFDVKGGDS